MNATYVARLDGRKPLSESEMLIATDADGSLELKALTALRARIMITPERNAR